MPFCRTFCTVRSAMVTPVAIADRHAFVVAAVGEVEHDFRAVAASLRSVTLSVLM